MRVTEHIFNAKQYYIIEINIQPTLKMINGSLRANPAGSCVHSGLKSDYPAVLIFSATLINTYWEQLKRGFTL